MFPFSVEKGAPPVLYRDIYFKDCWYEVRSSLKCTPRRKSCVRACRLYRHIVAVKATIDKQIPHAKIVVKVGGFYFRNGLCFFLFINSSPRLTLYRHIAAVKATIDKQSPHAKLLCLNISNEVEISSFWSWQKIYSYGGNNFCDPKTNDK